MIRIIRFESTEDLNSSISFEIRKKVFVEEQNVAEEDEFDEFEKSSIHYLLFDDSTPVATARWRFTHKGIKLERFAVLKEHRHSGFGQQILSSILDEVTQKNQLIYLHAQISALEFYKKNGFEIQGEQFTECNIEHYLMTYTNQYNAK